MLPKIIKLYKLEGYEINKIKSHERGRNLVYNCEQKDEDAKIIRISYRNDRSRADLLGELEYIRYLSQHGGHVSNVVDSLNGNLLEELSHNQHTFFVCLFEQAKGKRMVDHGYKYREGTPITEYYHNCGKVLGRLHQLSKDYNPVHRRYSIFDHYNNAYIEKVVPDSLPLLKEKLRQLLKTLEKLDIDRLSYGMVHFDYNDGNYMIDLETGDITVYDFDNSCYCWYMFDIASLWISGTGWIQREQKSEKRREFMNYYFKIAMEGYRSETNIEDSMLEQLPLFIQLTVMENIMDSFENMTNNAQNPECDNCLSYCIKLMEEDISYLGFFHEIYSTKHPFMYEKRNI